jgi:hypothetical protein
MSGNPFDLEALIRAVAIALGVGLIVMAIGFFSTRGPEERRRRKPVLLTGSVGVILILTIAIFYAWPSFIIVPVLDGRSQAQAEELLLRRRLAPNARPQYAPGVAKDTVIPKSQDPAAGLAVRSGTVVTFAVSVSNVGLPSGTGSEVRVSLTLFRPRSGETIDCARGATGVYTCYADGTSQGITAANVRLLLWVRPVNPPAETPGWYLQRAPVTGVTKIDPEGSWTGVVQIGNAIFPPHVGDVIDLAVSAAPVPVANELMGSSGVVVEDQPVGATTQTATNVSIKLR